jgi:hypothetical protein
MAATSSLIRGRTFAKNNGMVDGSSGVMKITLSRAFDFPDNPHTTSLTNMNGSAASTPAAIP